VRFSCRFRCASTAATSKLIAEFGEKRRLPVVIDQVPGMMIKAFLAAEDDRFFEHPGVDYQGLLRAGIQLVTHR
jgi:penicillin-binding protein 1A